MVAMAAANAAGVALFVVLYAVAAARPFAPAAFLACLAVVFALATLLWVRTEARQRPREALGRLGRAGVGLALVLVGTPMLALTPVFWLESRLPEAAGMGLVSAHGMAAVLRSLILIVLVNVAGGVVALVRGAAGRRPAV